MAISKIASAGITADFANTLTAADLAPNSVDSSELIDGAVDLSHMSVNSIDSDQYVDGSIDLVHMSANSIDSDQYVDASIDTAHLASNIAISTSGAITTTGAFTSIGIDDNADAVSIKIDANENVSFGGVTLETDWNANHDAIQIGLGGSLSARDNFSQTVIANNARCTGEDWATSPKYINAGQASAYGQWNIGTHRFLVSNESGSADGTITWKEAMTISNDGNVGIGTTDPAFCKLEVSQDGSSGPTFGLVSNHTGNAGSRNWQLKTNQDVWGDLSFMVSSANNTTPNGTSAMRLNSAGGLSVGTVGSVSTGNIVVNEGIYIGTASGNWQIRSSSSGSGSTTLYIGNAAIQVSSDERIKENIVNTEIDAMGKLNALRVVDFTWNDPSDLSFNNKNARGKYTGFIAQEVIDVLPFCVNAVRDEETLTPQPNAKNPAIPDILYEDGDGIPEGKKVGDVKEEGTPETDALWGMQYEYVVPVLVKAIQELSAKVTALESA